jgi:hypothetical protein
MMSDEIIKVLDYITEKLGVAIDWTAENALPYVEEVIGKFVTYNIVKHSIWTAVGLMLIFIFVGVLTIPKKSKKKCLQNKKSTVLYWYNSTCEKAIMNDDCMCAFTFGCGALFLIGMAFIGCNIGDLLKWSIIPEMALLEEIKYLVG